VNLFAPHSGFAVDLFLVLLVLLVPWMVWAVVLARRGKRRKHGRMMLIAYVTFLAGLIVFEIGVRFGRSGPPLARLPLWIHLCFSVPCLVLWTRQVMTAKRVADNPVRHRWMGRVVMGLLLATVGTGIWLYYATFA
jgi:uncharacterized membrane protein YozB (DUF420 family)